MTPLENKKYEICAPLVQIFEKCIYDTLSSDDAIREAFLNIVKCETAQELYNKK